MTLLLSMHIINDPYLAKLCHKAILKVGLHLDPVEMGQQIFKERAKEAANDKSPIKQIS